MTANPFLRLCQIKQWQPRFLIDTSDHPASAEQIDLEAKAALECNQADLCLGLIEIAQAMGIQSVEQLNLKATALSQLQLQQPEEQLKAAVLQRIQDQQPVDNGIAFETSPEELALLRGLLDVCATQQWTPQVLTEPRSSDPDAGLTTMVLKEAEAARQNQAPELALMLVDRALQHGFDSLWLLHSKALSLSQLEQFDLAHLLWEGLIQHDDLPDFVAVADAAYQHSQEQERRSKANPLLLELTEALQQHNLQPQFLPAPEEAQEDLDLQTLILQEAEALRNNDQAQLSADLLDIALNHGCDSLWLLHSKALSLSQLEQFELAHILWDELIQHDDLPDFEAVAVDAYRASEQREQSIQSTALLEALIGRIQQDHLQPQFLPCSGELNEDIDLQTLILQEAEALRNNDQAQLSADLLDIALNHGCDSLWLLHNKALALQKLGQLEAAIAVWKGLAHHEIEGFRNSVQSSLDSAVQELVLQQAQQAENSGSLEIAIETLTNALLNDPNQGAIETGLKAMLRKRRHGGTVPTETSPLEDHLDELDLNHAFLMQAEEHLAGSK